MLVQGPNKQDADEHLHIQPGYAVGVRWINSTQAVSGAVYKGLNVLYSDERDRDL